MPRNPSNYSLLAFTSQGDEQSQTALLPVSSLGKRSSLMTQNLLVRRFPWLGKTLFLVASAVWLCASNPRALGATGPESCAANPNRRQLDFWLGNWNVTFPGMPSTASSKVYLDLDKCLLIETWDGGKGHSGKNFLAYSPDDNRWHGMFADNQGRVHIFEGKIENGSAEFTGPSRGSNGETILNRIKVRRVSDTQVQQSWEKSTDNGATWALEFRGEYARQNP
jgi:hypothetical protein